MNKEELSKRIAKAILIQDKSPKTKSFRSFICLRNYFSQMSIEELLGIGTQYGIKDLL